jgi:hypothetical protein
MGYKGLKYHDLIVFMVASSLSRLPSNRSKLLDYIVNSCTSSFQILVDGISKVTSRLYEGNLVANLGLKAKKYEKFPMRERVKSKGLKNVNTQKKSNGDASLLFKEEQSIYYSVVTNIVNVTMANGDLYNGSNLKGLSPNAISIFRQNDGSTMLRCCARLFQFA